MNECLEHIVASIVEAVIEYRVGNEGGDGTFIVAVVTNHEVGSAGTNVERAHGEARFSVLLLAIEFEELITIALVLVAHLSIHVNQLRAGGLVVVPYGFLVVAVLIDGHNIDRFGLAIEIGDKFLCIASAVDQGEALSLRHGSGASDHDATNAARHVHLTMIVAIFRTVDLAAGLCQHLEEGESHERTARIVVRAATMLKVDTAVLGEMVGNSLQFQDVLPALVLEHKIFPLLLVLLAIPQVTLGAGVGRKGVAAQLVLHRGMNQVIGLSAQSQQTGIDKLLSLLDAAVAEIYLAEGHAHVEGPLVLQQLRIVAFGNEAGVILEFQAVDGLEVLLARTFDKQRSGTGVANVHNHVDTLQLHIVVAQQFDFGEFPLLSHIAHEEEIRGDVGHAVLLVANGTHCSHSRMHQAAQIIVDIVALLVRGRAVLGKQNVVRADLKLNLALELVRENGRLGISARIVVHAGVNGKNHIEFGLAVLFAIRDELASHPVERPHLEDIGSAQFEVRHRQPLIDETAELVRGVGERHLVDFLTQLSCPIVNGNGLDEAVALNLLRFQFLDPFGQIAIVEEIFLVEEQ